MFTKPYQANCRLFPTPHLVVQGSDPEFQPQRVHPLRSKLFPEFLAKHLRVMHKQVLGLSKVCLKDTTIVDLCRVLVVFR